MTFNAKCLKLTDKNIVKHFSINTCKVDDNHFLFISLLKYLDIFIKMTSLLLALLKNFKITQKLTLIFILLIIFKINI